MISNNSVLSGRRLWLQQFILHVILQIRFEQKISLYITVEWDADKNHEILLRD